jgi:hypothetical protein
VDLAERAVSSESSESDPRAAAFIRRLAVDPNFGTYFAFVVDFFLPVDPKLGPGAPF